MEGAAISWDEETVFLFKDIKKYHYYYWFAFPVSADLICTKNSVSPITEYFNETQVQCTDFLVTLYFWIIALL